MNGERGQALPLAILVLAIGSLVVAPFLGHAGASLTASRVYGQGLAEIYACDAGVEHAIWSLTRGGMADAFTGPGDQVTDELPETVNDLTATVTITANATASGGSPGEIGNSVIDSLEFDTDKGVGPDIVPISGDIYAIAYQGKDDDGFLRTVSIGPDGGIGDSVIDSLEFDTVNGREPDIINISGDCYAIAYRSDHDVGFLKTVSIGPDGSIGDIVIDSLEFDTDKGVGPDIIPVSGDIYAIAYQGQDDDGFLRTVSIGADGGIGDSVIDSLEFDTVNGREPDIINISGDCYAIVYRGDHDVGFLKTVSIGPDGSIGDSVIDSLEFDINKAKGPHIVPVSEDVYAIGYQGQDDDGFLRTIDITTGGGTEAAYEIVASAGGRTIRAFVNVNGEAASIVSWRTE
jgi:hypothetical protein